MPKKRILREELTCRILFHPCAVQKTEHLGALQGFVDLKKNEIIAEYQMAQSGGLMEMFAFSSSVDQTLFWLQKLQSLQEYCLASPLTG